MYNVGIDIGGSKAAIGIVDGKDIIKKESVPVNTNDTAEVLIERICNKIGELVKETDIKNIGAGCPGLVRGDFVSAPNVNLEGNIKEIFKKYYKNVHITLVNDANAAAYAEFLYGSLKGCTNGVFITLGTGFGGGLIINKELFTGSYGVGAEFGHQVINVNGELCGCGNKGCIEAYASTAALIKRATLDDNIKNSLIYTLAGSNLESINGKIIFEAYDKGDELAQKLLKKHIEYIGVGIINLSYIFNPDKISIGGGISARWDILGDLITKYISSTPNLWGGKFEAQINAAEFSNDAGIIGAANLYL